MAKRLFKRVLILLGVAAVGLFAFLAVTAWLYRTAPAFYVTRLTPEELDAAAQVAERKLIEAGNWANHTRAIESARSKGVTTDAIGGTTLSISSDELNAYFQKWQGFIDWEGKYGQYLSQPSVAAADGRIVLAGYVKEFRTVASLHFRPVLDARGELALTLEKIMAGRLPMPSVIWSSQKDRISGALASRLPEWQRQARMDKTGATNDAGVLAGMTRLLLNVLRGDPSDPVIFIPDLVQRRAIPAKITAVSVKDGWITLSVDPMDAGERRTYLARIKEPARLQAAMGQ